MEFGDLRRLLLRRWLILAVGFVLVIGGAAAVYSTAARTYQTTGQGLLLLPPDANNPALETSPFLYLPQGLNVIGRVVNQRMQTPGFRRQMESSGHEADFQLGIDNQTPIVTITVEGSDAADTIQTRDELMRQFALILAEVQREEAVPTRQFAHVRFLDPSDEVDPLSGDRLRAAAVAGVGGAVLVLIVAVGWDRFASRRPRRRLNGDTTPKENYRSAGSEEAESDNEGTKREMNGDLDLDSTAESADQDANYATPSTTQSNDPLSRDESPTP